MKRKLFWAMGAMASVGLVFWMRALASWKPQLIAASGAPAAITTFNLSPDGTFLVVGDHAIYDLENQQWTPSVPAHEKFYGFASDESYFSVQDVSPNESDALLPTSLPIPLQIKRRQPATGKVVWSASTSRLYKEGQTLAVALSSDQRSVLLRGRTLLKAFDARTGDTLWQRPVPFIQSGRFAVTGQTLWVSNGRELGVMEAITGRLLWRIPTRGWPTAGGVSPDKRVAWLATAKNGQLLTASFYDTKTDKLLWTVSLDARPSNPPSPIAFSRDGGFVALLGAGRIQWFEAKSGRCLGSRVGLGGARTQAMTFSRDSNFLYTLDQRGRVWKWRLR